MINSTITTDSVSAKPLVCGSPGTSDWSKKLSSQHRDKTMMVSSSNELSHHGFDAAILKRPIETLQTFDGLFPGLRRFSQMIKLLGCLQLAIVFYAHRDLLRARAYL